MISLRQSLAVILAAGSLYLFGIVWWSSPASRTARIAYAQQPSETTVDQEESIAGAEKLSKAFRAAARLVKPAVVRINSMVRPRSQRLGMRGGDVPGLPEEFRRFFGEDPFRAPDPRGRRSPPTTEDEPELQPGGVGSGVIVSTDGYILTNNHVVDGAEELDVQLSDGRSFPGKVIGTDDKSDVAVIKIEAKGLAAARLGDSNSMDVGDWVIAVGSPFELDQTVTAGIISATNRSVDILDYEDFLQTDAAINPGNSGGPLVNLRGEVIGINTAINSRTGSNAGVGFAIPSSMARLIMDNLIENGRVVRGFIGATLETLTPDVARELKLGDIVARGVVVRGVAKDSPAAKSGLQPGDVILRVDGQPVRTSESVRNRVSLTKPGKTVRFDVNRNKKEMAIALQVEELTDQRLAEAGGRIEIEGLGIVLEKLSPSAARQLRMDPNSTGAIVVEVKPGRGARLGLEQFDVILEVNGVEITDPEQVANQIRKSNGGLRMLIQRGNSLLSLRING